MKKYIVNIFLLLSLNLASLSIEAQITSGSNGGSGATEGANNNKAGGGVVGNTNAFNGKFQSSYTLGTVTSPIGLSYTLTMSNQSSFNGGDNPPFMSGIPYGEGWNLDIPTITVRLVTKSKYTPDQWENHQNSATSPPAPNIDLSQSPDPNAPCIPVPTADGKVKYFAPELSIPGVASGRLVLKNLNDNETGGIYVLHDFETYIEATFNGNAWIVKLPNGTTYTFAKKKYNVVNPTNQRYHPDDFNSNSTGDAEEAMNPTPIPTEWMLTEITNNSKNVNYKILFKYKEYGKFNFHEETINYDNHYINQDYYDNSELDLPQEIFLEEVLSVYSSSSQHDQLITLERLVLEYEEDLSLVNPNMLYSTMPGGITNYDDLYAGKAVYFRGATGEGGSTPYTDWKRYTHIKNLPGNPLYSFANSNNPYVDYDGGYHRKKITGSGSPQFDHCFLESPKEVCSFTNGGASFTPPGDLYNISCKIGSGIPGAYCNFDINLVTGQGNETIPGTSYEALSEGSYNNSRYNTVLTTFGNINKWNVDKEDFSSRSSVVTSNYFYLPSLPVDFNGFYIQVGPANSDNDFQLDRMTIMGLGGINPRLEFIKTFYNHNIGNNILSKYWRERPYAKLQSNFGIGFPWYAKQRIYDNKLTLYSNFKGYRDGSHNATGDLFYEIYKDTWWDDNSSSPNNNKPTMSTGFYLQYVNLTRISKKPLVLKRVKVQKLKNGTTTVSSEDYLTTIKTLEFEYETKTLDVYENAIYSDINQAVRNKISDRNVIVLKKIKNTNSTNIDDNPVVTFDYKKIQLCNTGSLTSELFEFQPGKWVFKNNTDGYVLDKIIDTKGKVTEVTYMESINDLIVTDLAQNKYRYVPDLRTNFGFTPSKQMGFSYAKQFNVRVSSVKTTAHDNKYTTQGYTYTGYITRGGPKIPDDQGSFNTFGSFGGYHGTVISFIIPEYGFSSVNVTTTYHDAVNVGSSYQDRITYTHSSDKHLFGKLTNQKIWEITGAGTNLIGETVYTYEYIKAFESAYKGAITYDGNCGEAPNTEDGNDIIRNQNRAQFTDYYNYLTPTEQNDLKSGKQSGSHAFVAKFTDVRIEIRKGRKLNWIDALEEDDNIDVLYPGYRDAYFVKLVKVEETTHDLATTNSITYTTEYDYFDANYQGRSTSKGYDYIFRTELTSPSQYHQLKLEPSWLLYSTTSYSSNAPGISTCSENFYYFDIANRYSAFESTPNLKAEFPMGGPSDRFSFSGQVRGLNNFTENGLEAMGYARFHSNRTILMESRQIAKRTGEADHIQSKYYLYKVLPLYDIYTTDPTTGEIFEDPKYNLLTSLFEFTENTPVINQDPTPPDPGIPAGTDPFPTVVGVNGGTLNGPAGPFDPTDDDFDPTAVGTALTYVYSNPGTTTGTILHDFIVQKVDNELYNGNIQEYFFTHRITDIINDLIPNYDDTDPNNRIVANYLVSCLVVLHNKLDRVQPQYTMPYVKVQYDDSSLRAFILYEERYSEDLSYGLQQLDPFYEFGNGGPNTEYRLPDVWDPRKRYSEDYLRLEQEIIQVDYKVLDDFTNKFSGYSSTLPPILNFEFIQDQNVSQNNYFKPIFPYDTMRIMKTLALDKFGKINESLDQNFVISKSTHFQQKLTSTFHSWIDNNTGLPYDEKRVFKLETQSIGLPKERFIAYGTNAELKTEFEYNQYDLPSKVTSPNGEYVINEYDDFHRPLTKKVSGHLTSNDYTLQTFTYSTWHTENLYSGPTSKGNTLTDDYATKNKFNYVEVKNYIDGSNKYSITRSYFDAEGRNNQSARSVYNSGYIGYTLYSPKAEYDLRGLTTKIYKPYKVTTSGLDLSFNNFSTSGQPFASYSYEPNLNSRLLEAADYGQTLGGSNTVHAEETIIDLTTLESDLYLNGANAAVKTEILPEINTSCSFIKYKTTDQDGKESYIYSNALGQAIAVKTIINSSTSEEAITFTKYNSQGSSIKTINPKGQAIEYKYNLMGWVYEESHPDKGITRYMYDRNGNIVLMADETSTLLKSGTGEPSYTYYTYDILGRQTEISKVKLNSNIIFTGASIDNTKKVAPLWYEDVLNYIISDDNNNQVKFNEPFSFIKTLSWKFKVTKYDANDQFIAEHGITTTPNNSFIYLDYANKTLIRKFYYDVTPSFSFPSVPANQEISSAGGLQHLKGRPSGAEVFDKNGKTIMYKWFSYTNRGNIDFELQQFRDDEIISGYHGLTFKIAYDYEEAGRLKTKYVYKADDNVLSGAISVKRSYRYTYDSWGRLENLYYNDATHNYNNGDGKRIAKTEYDDVYGYVNKISYYANDNNCELLVDEITYDRSTDVRNRLTEINSKFFTEKLFYDGSNLSATDVVTNSATDLPNHSNNYNGNINYITAEYRFGGMNSSNTGPLVSNAPDLQGNPQNTNFFKGKSIYGYTYDGMNRLTNADLTIEDHIISASSTASLLAYGDETFEYDKIGNITRLLRYHNTNTIGTPPTALTDDWDYNYTSSTNRLASIRQHNTSTDLRAYTYDELGNTTSDNYRLITQAEYGFANMLFNLKIDQVDYNYLYDENNNRIFKEEANNLLTKEFYLIDATGSLLAVIDASYNDVIEWQIEGVAKEQRVLINPQTYQYEDKIVYLVKDHLTNLRVSYEVTQCVTCLPSCEILDYTLHHVADYYAYGKILREYTGIINSNSYPERFQTTGNERDKETGWDYRMARYYDADIGRFTGVDALDFLAQNWTPYRYAFDNPVLIIDPSGLIEDNPKTNKLTLDQTMKNNKGKDFTYDDKYYEYTGRHYDKKRDIFVNTWREIGIYYYEFNEIFPAYEEANYRFSPFGGAGGSEDESVTEDLKGFFKNIGEVIDRFDIDVYGSTDANITLGIQARAEAQLGGAKIGLDGNLVSMELLGYRSKESLKNMSGTGEFNWVGKNGGTRIRQSVGGALIVGVKAKREFIGKMGSYEKLKDKGEVQAGYGEFSVESNENGTTTVKVSFKAAVSAALILGIDLSGRVGFKITF